MTEYSIKVVIPDQQRDKKLSTAIDDAPAAKTTAENVQGNSTGGAGKNLIPESAERVTQDKAERRKEIKSAALAGAATIMSAANYAVQLHTTRQQTSMNIRGDYLAAENYGKRMAVYSEVGNTAVGIGLAFAVNPALGAAAVAQKALDFAKKALIINEQQRAYRAEGARQQFEYNLNAERLIRNYSRYR